MLDCRRAEDELDQEPTREQVYAWADALRPLVVDYMAAQGVRHGEISPYPAWEVYPYVTIWAVESGANRGSVGWWVIAGDCPMDYVTCHGDRTPRTAARDFGERWQAAAAAMMAGKAPDGVSFGERSQWPELAPLLDGRAKFLLYVASKDDEWAWMNE